MRRMFNNAFSSNQQLSPSSTSPGSAAPPHRIAHVNEYSSKPLTGRSPRLNGNDDEFSPERLPFGGTRREKSRFGGSNGSPSTVATPLTGEAALGPSRKVNEAKGEHMLSLLTSQAVLDVRGYEVLDFESVERLKRDQKKFMARITAVEQKYALEQRLRAAAALLSRSLPDEKSGSDLQEADQRLETLTSDLNSLKARENAIRERLLRHIGACLAHSVRKYEEERTGAYNESTNGTSTGGMRSPMSESLPSPFEGPHLFAGNPDSVPQPWGSFSSPDPPSASSFSGMKTARDLPSAEPSVVQGVDPAIYADLEAEVDRLRRSASTATREVDDLKSQLREHQRSLTDAQNDASRSRNGTSREVDELKAQLREQQSLLADAQSEGARSRTGVTREIDDLTYQLKEQQSLLADAQSEGARSRTGVTREMDDLKYQLKEQQRLLEEAQNEGSKSRSDTTREVDDLKYQLKEQQRLLEEAQNEVSRSRTGVTREVDDLKYQLKEQQRLLEEAQNEGTRSRTGATKAVDDLRSQLREQQRLLDDAQSDASKSRTAATREIEDLRTQLSEQERFLEDAKRDVNRSKTGASRELEEVRAQLRDHQILLEAAKRDATRSKEDSEQELETVRSKLRDQERIVTEAKNEAVRSKSDAESGSSRSRGQIEVLEKDLASMRDDVSRQRQRADDAETKHKDLTRRLDDARDSSDEAQSKVRELTQELNDQRRSGDASEVKAKDLADKLDVARSEREDFEAKVRDLTQQLDVLQGNGKTAETARQREVADLRSNTRLLETKLQDSERRVEDGDISLRKAESSVREAESRRVEDWQVLMSSLSSIGSSHAKQHATLGQFLSDLPLQPPTPSSRRRFASSFSSALEDHFTSITSSMEALRSQSSSASEAQKTLETTLNAAKTAQAKAESDLDQERRRATALDVEVKELQSKLTTASEASAQVTKLETELSASKQAAKESTAEAERQMATHTKTIEGLQSASNSLETSLKELWKTVPNTDSRANIAVDSDLSILKQAFEIKVVAPKRSRGLLGLGRSNSTSSNPEVEDYTFELLMSRMKMLVESDKKLIERLIKHESEKEVYKQNASRAQKLVEESQNALRTYQQQVKELEERVEYSDTQAATMLERMNDLMEGEERANSNARRAEASNKEIQTKLTTLTAERDQIKEYMEAVRSQLESQAETLRSAKTLEQDLRKLKDELEDVNAELDESKERESKARSNFLSELNSAQTETSSLRTKLRQAERQARG